MDMATRGRLLALFACRADGSKIAAVPQLFARMCRVGRDVELMSALARALGVLGRGLARNMLFDLLPHSVSTFSIGSNMPPAASALQGIGKLRKVWCCEMESHK